MTPDGKVQANSSTTEPKGESPMRMGDRSLTAILRPAIVLIWTLTGATILDVNGVWILGAILASISLLLLAQKPSRTTQRSSDRFVEPSIAIEIVCILVALSICSKETLEAIPLLGPPTLMMFSALSLGRKSARVCRTTVFFVLSGSVLLGGLQFYFAGAWLPLPAFLLCITSALPAVVGSVVFDAAQNQDHGRNIGRQLSKRVPQLIAVQNAIDRGAEMTVIEADLDHFHHYNEAYGFDAGDELLGVFARVLHEVIEAKSGDCGSWYHIEADRFLLLVPCGEAVDIARHVFEEMDRLIPSHYGDSDRKKGTLTVHDRSGDQLEIPFVSVSMAGIELRDATFERAVEVRAKINEVKRATKTCEGNTFMIGSRASDRSPARPHRAI